MSAPSVVILPDRASLFGQGVRRVTEFCNANKIPMPGIRRLAKTDRLFHLATCAYYRPCVISIMVEKCASHGMGGRAWSWPGYVIDRTPYGLMAHEMGHHVDHVRSERAKSRDDVESLFSWRIYQQSKEPALTGYLDTDTMAGTFFMEWFAEHFRLYVMNPDLCKELRPRFTAAMTGGGFVPLPSLQWEAELLTHRATPRIIEMARKKIREK